MSRRFVTRKEILAVAWGIVAFAGGFATAQQAELFTPSAAVPLVSGTCPSVSANGRIALDWNPGFDHEGAVTGLRSFRLVFHPLRQDGVNPNLAVKLVVDHFPGGSATPVGNGYYHLEARLPRGTRPGVYQLADAHTSPQLSPDYQGEEPVATVSPVREHFCITVLPAVDPAIPSASKPDQAGGPFMTASPS